ncbi:MAG TPA: hypothetical protein VIY72_07200 [Acidimicrobiales bacterium]
MELDEELHFNRYRAVTLCKDWASLLPWTEDYLGFVTEEEPLCSKAAGWGKRWTSPSSEAMFGQPSAPGDFSGGGAPRWKQRALYDAMKDLASIDGAGLRLVRLSVHDRVGTATLHELLTGRADPDLDSLASLVSRRVNTS